MHRSSECVAAIATALAKAQIELTNPEKSKVGTITHNNRGDSPQTFRYAPLSGGLEIIRKTLGGQQIAVAQSTAIDQANKIVNLTTILIHTSGEWISSEWPVCQLSDTSAPRRMGAALTYARRYALFTLVGIAGEDDLDAPEFQTNNAPASQTEAPRPRVSKSSERPSNSKIADPVETAPQFDQLQSEIAAHTSIKDLQARAPAILKAKNTLPTDEAKVIEQAFASKLVSLQSAPAIEAKPVPGNCSSSDRTSIKKSKTGKTAFESQPPIQPNVRTSSKIKGRLVTPPKSTADVELGVSAPVKSLPRAAKIEKPELAIGEPRRHRDKSHLRFVASHPCLICGRSPADAHHLRFVQPRAMGRKASDEFTVPLCRTHHRDNHRFGDEKSWWKRSAIDPIEVSRTLWQSSRGTPAPIIVDNKLDST